MLEYCRSDVDILRRGSLKFRSIFLKQTDVDPFASSITIASACNVVFRRNYLRPDTIGIIPATGYRHQDTHSRVAIKWLKWVSHDQGIRVQHALNGGEVAIGRYRVDGLHEKTVFEFHGCLWHGCPKCFRRRDVVSPMSSLNIRERYEETVRRSLYIKSKGYEVVEMWECDFNKALKQNPRMKEFVDNLNDEEVPPLRPRDAFFGGRTNATKLYHKTAPGEKIKYVDVCSLYPWVCKYGKFPVGHPTIITENFDSGIENYEGFIKADISPPRGLYHPVLPRHAQGKLMFALCGKCCDELQTSECRVIRGTWVSEELKKALATGYKLEEIHEVWHFSETAQYDPDTKKGGLFADYINTFLKLKQEASGWPKWCDTEEKKMQYVVEYERHQGIRLDPSQIQKNEGMRAVAKLMLNSFGGKFGQRSSMPKTAYLSDPAPFFDLLLDESKKVKHVNFVNDEVVQVQWQHEEEFVEPMGNTNVAIAAYTTAQARLKLYSFLERLGERVLYYDTDSIIYLSREGSAEYEPPLGDYLGDLTDELAKDYGAGSYITEFASGGPKNYGYTVFSSRNNTEVSTCKVRGITLNFRNTRIVNYGTLREMVKAHGLDGDSDTKKVVHDPHRIARVKFGQVITRQERKDYRLVYTKRVILDDFKTLPYGY